MAGPEDYAARDRPHISISAFREATQYSFPTRAQQRKPLREDYAAHAVGLLNQLNLALGSLPVPAADPRLSVDGLKPGTMVEVSTLPPGEDSRARAAKIPANLEFPAQDIVVLRTERRSDRTKARCCSCPMKLAKIVAERRRECRHARAGFDQVLRPSRGHHAADDDCGLTAELEKNRQMAHRYLASGGGA